MNEFNCEFKYSYNLNQNEKIWKMEESKNNTININITEDRNDNYENYKLLELDDFDNELKEPFINKKI